MKLFCTFALTGVIGLLSATAFGQAPATGPAASAPAPLYSTRTTLVLIPALVTTHGGEPVFTLAAKDFTVTDDGIEQQVTLEEDTGGEPLALVVVIETGGAGSGKFNKYGKLAPLVEAVVGNVEHEVAVVTFDSEPAVVQGFTPDLTAVKSAVDGLTPGNGGAAILDGLAFSVELLRRQPSRYRRAILLISETVDHGSKVKLDEALRAVSDTNTAIYTLAFSSARADLGHESSKFSQPDTPGPPGGCMGRDPDKDIQENRLKQAWECLNILAPPLRAAKMAAILGINGLHKNVPETVAQLTGGEYFHFENERSIERALLTLSNHLPNRYVLSFHPQSPHPGLHALKLQLKEYPNLVLTGRSSYWADPEADPVPRS